MTDQSEEAPAHTASPLFTVFAADAAIKGTALILLPISAILSVILYLASSHIYLYTLNIFFAGLMAIVLLVLFKKSSSFILESRAEVMSHIWMCAILATLFLPYLIEKYRDLHAWNLITALLVILPVFIALALGLIVLVKGVAALSRGRSDYLVIAIMSVVVAFISFKLL